MYISEHAQGSYLLTHEEGKAKRSQAIYEKVTRIGEHPEYFFDHADKVMYHAPTQRYYLKFGRVYGNEAIGLTRSEMVEALKRTLTMEEIFEDGEKVRVYAYRVLCGEIKKSLTRQLLGKNQENDLKTPCFLSRLEILEGVLRDEKEALSQKEKGEGKGKEKEQGKEQGKEEKEYITPQDIGAFLDHFISQPKAALTNTLVHLSAVGAGASLTLWGKEKDEDDDPQAWQRDLCSKIDYEAPIGSTLALHVQQSGQRGFFHTLIPLTQEMAHAYGEHFGTSGRRLWRLFRLCRQNKAIPTSYFVQAMETMGQLASIAQEKQFDDEFCKTKAYEQLLKKHKIHQIQQNVDGKEKNSRGGWAPLINTMRKQREDEQENQNERISRDLSLEREQKLTTLMSSLVHGPCLPEKGTTTTNNTNTNTNTNGNGNGNENGTEDTASAIGSVMPTGKEQKEVEGHEEGNNLWEKSREDFPEVFAALGVLNLDFADLFSQPNERFYAIVEEKKKEATPTHGYEKTARSVAVLNDLKKDLAILAAHTLGYDPLELLTPDLTEKGLKALVDQGHRAMDISQTILRPFVRQPALLLSTKDLSKLSYKGKQPQQVTAAGQRSLLGSRSLRSDQGFSENASSIGVHLWKFMECHYRQTLGPKGNPGAKK